MSDDLVPPSEEDRTPAGAGDPPLIPGTDSETRNTAGETPPDDAKSTAHKTEVEQAGAKQPGRMRKTARFFYKAGKAVTLITALTAPIRGTPGNMLYRSLKTTGILPKTSQVDELETPYKYVADKTFADSIEAAPLPQTPLRPACVDNYVLEANGQDLPVYLLHGETIGPSETLRRLNTTLYHAQNVAASYDATLEKITGHPSNVKLIDTPVFQGIYFHGPQAGLLQQHRTVVNNSVGLSSLDPTADSSGYNAWIFHAAGNTGDEVESNTPQPQPGGQTFHSPRSVLIGAPYHYSSHCGPTFYSGMATGGHIKGDDARISWLPSATSRNNRDADGREAIQPGWGGTSNASPCAAGKFSALMERYANYLSEEQIFTALCHAVSQTQQEKIAAATAIAKSAHETTLETSLEKTLGEYQSSTLPGATQPHFFDPVKHGFGELSQAALEKADAICQDMVLYAMHNPSCISQPTSYSAQLCFSDRQKTADDGLYRYTLQLPEAVNLGNVILTGTAPTGQVEKEDIFLTANNARIRLPVGTTSPWQEFGGSTSGPTAFIGSTRGFTTCGPTSRIDIASTVPLDGDTRLTCYNTLAEYDVASHIGGLHDAIRELQSQSPKNIRMAEMIDASGLYPQRYDKLLAMAPSHLSTEDIQTLLAQRHMPQEYPSPPEKDVPEPQETAFWRRKEDIRITSTQQRSHRF